jgi:hypothetical protein
MTLLVNLMIGLSATVTVYSAALLVWSVWDARL